MNAIPSFGGIAPGSRLDTLTPGQFRTFTSEVRKLTACDLEMIPPGDKVRCHWGPGYFFSMGANPTVKEVWEASDIVRQVETSSTKSTVVCATCGADFGSSLNHSHFDSFGNCRFQGPTAHQATARAITWLEKQRDTEAGEKEAALTEIGVLKIERDAALERARTAEAELAEARKEIGALQRRLTTALATIDEFNEAAIEGIEGV